MQKHTDALVEECELCKGKVRKLMGTPALQFKGSGWYITDYAGKSPKPSDAARKESGESSAEKPAAAAPSCPSGSCCGTKSD